MIFLIGQYGKPSPIKSVMESEFGGACLQLRGNFVSWIFFTNL
jgi:hypothetical protein